MKIPAKLLMLASAMLAATPSMPAAIRYVDVNSANPVPPYTNWATAAATIQQAVDAAEFSGDQVLVTNGVYRNGGVVLWALTNRVYVSKWLIIQSVNGPQFTVIEGYQVPDTTNGDEAVRCVYLGSGASLSGFTLTNGATRLFGGEASEQNGGGVYAAFGSVVSNCVITGNAAAREGGGAYSGRLVDCVLAGNSAENGGGATRSTLENCVLRSNTASENGGGAFGGTLSNCVVIGNSASRSGGGAAGDRNGPAPCVLDNCVISSNSVTGAMTVRPTSGDGGGVSLSRLRNCAVLDNTANGLGGGAFGSTLNNCTVMGNSAASGGGVGGIVYLFGPSDSASVLTNCIVYYNRARRIGDNFDDASTLNFCCTIPLPFSGTGNLTAEPRVAGNWRLNPDSPCRGAGTTVSAAGIDLDNEAWASPPSIGCDEYQSGSVTGAVTVAILASCTNVATGFVVDFEQSISGRVNASRWEFGDGTVLSNRPYASHAWAIPGDYAVVLRAYSESYPAGLTATVTVHVVTQPVHYVALDSATPSSPYASWLNAATNIQDAVDAATVPGALVVVSNGVYETGVTVVLGTSNRLAATSPVSVKSVNGPAATFIVGSGFPERLRCVYLTAGAMLSGFTLTNGVTQNTGLPGDEQRSGGGIYCEWPSTVVSNCVIGGNQAYTGGGVAGGTLIHCTLAGNSVGLYQAGGGASGSRLYSCTVVSNTASWGGGASDCTLNDCVLIRNRGADAIYFPLPFAGYAGGADRSTLNGCLVVSNSAASGGGVANSKLRNCALFGNVATGGLVYNGAGGGGGASSSTLVGCTLTGNSVLTAGVGGGGGVISCTLINSIAFDNNSPEGGQNYAAGFFGNSSINYSCTTPMPPDGVGNVANAPLFVGANDLRLQAGSPCINAGRTALALGVTDLDGNPRVVGGAVDMGAYEYASPASVLSYAWAQQHGLPIDGSADYADSDTDHMNNWQEWIAGTVPTDATSALRLLGLVKDGADVVVTWQSVNDREYFLERAGGLTGTPPFSAVAGNIPGQSGATSYTDTNAIGTGPFFYRVGVQQ